MQLACAICNSESTVIVDCSEHFLMKHLVIRFCNDCKKYQTQIYDKEKVYALVVKELLLKETDLTKAESDFLKDTGPASVKN